MPKRRKSQCLWEYNVKKKWTNCVGEGKLPWGSDNWVDIRRLSGVNRIKKHELLCPSTRIYVWVGGNLAPLRAWRKANEMGGQRRRSREWMRWGWRASQALYAMVRVCFLILRTKENHWRILSLGMPLVLRRGRGWYDPMWIPCVKKSLEGVRVLVEKLVRRLLPGLQKDNVEV